MRHSVETRLPFLDYRLMEAAVSIPLEHKLHRGWTKYVIRKVAEPYLPAEVTWRTFKLGFEAPTSVWLKDYRQGIRREIGDSDVLRELVDVDAVLKDFDSLRDRYKWGIFNLAVWARVFAVTA